MPIDLKEDLAAALRSPEVRAALAEVLTPVVRSEVKAGFVDHQADQHLTLRQAAQHCGTSYAALLTRLSGDEELQKLRIGQGRLTRFRRSDLDLWLSRRQPRRRHKGTGGT
jgi:predicted DNA-binding transcriptional regulator AlpA